MVWLKMHVLVSKIIDGDGLTTAETTQFGTPKKQKTKKGWKYPKVHLKITSGVSSTAVGSLAV